MTPGRLLAVGAAILAVSVAWIAMRATHASAALAPAYAGSESMTVEFFRNPTEVPAFSVRTLDGGTLAPGDFRGRVTLINFWATWCGPCRSEIPSLVALQAKYRDQLQIVGISEDEAPPDAVKSFASGMKMNYPVAMTTPEIEKLFPGIDALPTTFVVDRDGRVVQKHIGMLGPAQTEQEVRALAGLEPHASVKLVDPDKPQGLDNVAEVASIPGVDLSKVPADRRGAVLEKMNTDPCTCGCGLTVARCRIDDPSCGVSLPLARQIVAAAIR
ncbi:MAG: TlpA family protein disulfide reductase [Betaproteobacteria bacterium]